MLSISTLVHYNSLFIPRTKFKMMDRDLVGVCNTLKQKSILIPPQNEWLRSCVEYFRSENPRGSLESLADFVLEQWLLADLSDIGVASLPANSSDVPFVTLNGKYCVQISSVVNVAESFYKQLESARRPDSRGNLEVGEEVVPPSREPVSRRSLRMEITDGVTQVLAFEDRSIPQLKEPVTPGLKAILVGPIECRNGVLLLKAENVRVLGGEVDTLIVPNAVENILARALGVEETTDPYRSYVDPAEGGDRTALPVTGEPVESATPQNGVVPQSRPSAGRNAEETIDLDYDFDDDEFELIAAQTASLAERSATVDSPDRGPKVQSSLRSFLVPSTATARPQVQSNAVRNNPKTQPSYGRGSRSSQESQGSSGSRRSSFAGEGAPYSQASTVESEWRPCLRGGSSEMPRPSEEEGRILIDNLNDRQLVEALLSEELPETADPEPPRVEREVRTSFEVFPPRTFPSERRVAAAVVRLPQKLSVKDDEWCLPAVVVAKGVELEVDFSPSAVNKIFGITAAEVKAKRSEVQKNPKIKEQINELLRVNQLKIRNLNCEVLIKFSSFIGKPVILDIFDST